MLLAAVVLCACGGGGGSSDSSGPPANSPPVASFTATPSAGSIPLTVQFDATASTDAGGSIASYSWDYGDGSAAGSGSTTSYVFNAAGTFTVTLTVTDNLGARGSTTRQVTANSPPVASFTASPSAGTIPVTVQFDASASTDDDGSIATYSWDYGDGSAAGSGRTTGHIYNVVGTHIVTLTVTDNLGASGSATRQVTANDVTYRVIELGNLPGGIETYVFGINDVGQVTGSSWVPPNEVAFFWDESSGGMIEGPAGYARGQALNDVGKVLVDVGSGGSATVWDVSTGSLTQIQPPAGVTARIFGYGINNSGKAVGYLEIPIQGGTEHHAFVWDPGTQTTADLNTALGHLPPNRAHGINESNEIVGFTRDTQIGSEEIGFVLSLDSGTVTDLDNFGAVGGSSGARAINDAGQVVGYAAVTLSSLHAFIWDPATGTMTDLGELSGGQNYSEARSVNEVGRVVGTSQGQRTPQVWDASTSGPRGFLWDKYNGMRDLNDRIDSSDPLKTHVEIWDALGINERGEIIVQGYDIRTLAPMGFLLRPM